MMSMRDSTTSGSANHPSRAAETIRIDASSLPKIGDVDERYQSYNVEMAEVIGGNFWRPYADSDQSSCSAQEAAPAQMDLASFEIGDAASNVFEARPPVDLDNRRLRILAAALGPAYVRVSGTWANSAYFHDSDDPAPSPPDGFQGVLTRRQWAGVIDFARAVDAKIVTSFAISAGVRDADGVWTADQAARFLARTKELGGAIAAAELFNEPTIAEGGGGPPGYDAEMFARDEAVFRSFLTAASPETLIAGPGSMGEGLPLIPAAAAAILTSEELLAGPPPPMFDVFSYHSYGAVSQRCAGMGADMTTSKDAALSEEWLARADLIFSFYASMRDRFQPGKAMWLTETAESACGGNPWAATFLDSFRYLDQLGRLARSGLSVHMHNTLAASEYALLDSQTFAPRPNYWAAWLWRQFMGTSVLDAGASRPGLHLYAHNLRDRPDGVAVLAINLDREQPATIDVAAPCDRYTLTAHSLDDSVVQLNGRDLTLGPNDALPELDGVHAPSGQVELPPTSITFLAIRNAG